MEVIISAFVKNFSLGGGQKKNFLPNRKYAGCQGLAKGARHMQVHESVFLTLTIGYSPVCACAHRSLLP
jgi:hypothetical protein